MNKESSNILFITDRADRGMFLLGRMLNDRGFSITIAAPRNNDSKFWLWGKFIRLRKIGTYILPNKTICAEKYDKIFAFDDLAAKFAVRAKLSFTRINLDFGLDPNIWTPAAAGAARQTRFLSEFGISPSARIVAVISPLGHGLDLALHAADSLNDKEVMFMLLGRARNAAAKRVLRQISLAGSGHKFVCAGDITDLATFLRAATMIVSLGGADVRLMKKAVSMGRPTIWDKSDIAPNIQIKGDLASALTKGLNLTMNERTNFEKKNLIAAQKFSIDKTLKEFLTYL